MHTPKEILGETLEKAQGAQTFVRAQGRPLQYGKRFAVRLVEELAEEAGDLLDKVGIRERLKRAIEECTAESAVIQIDPSKPEPYEAYDSPEAERENWSNVTLPARKIELLFGTMGGHRRFAHGKTPSQHSAKQ
ncbi:MAG: hypothetical protein Q8P27_03100 [Candidatus Peregrinibacteria bacterium]|nr:hypothetical protein [Candidatus Peregrinibacteria bacterium]